MNAIFSKFIFNGESSDKHDVMAVIFGDSSNDSYSADIQTELTTYLNKRNGTFNITEQNYSEPMSFTLQIVNKDFSDFNVIKEKEIKNWLCKRGAYSWFNIDVPGYEQIFWKMNISNPKLKYLGGTVGMEFECILDSPWGYSSLIERTFQITDSDRNILLHINSDEDDYIYPDMTITMKGYGTLEIKNSSETEHRTFSLENTVIDEIITLNNSLPYISSSQNGHNIYNDFNKHWIRLGNGVNTLTFNLNCIVTFRYREIRKAGLFL